MRTAGVGTRVRIDIIQGMAATVRGRLRDAVAAFHGLESNGRLRGTNLDAVTNPLQPAAVYELMRHEGRLDRSGVSALSCCSISIGRVSWRR